jgi:hypothetical protein
MKRDLFLAILSMDSYNRSYGQHLTELDDAYESSGDVFLGNALLQKNSFRDLPGSAASGFYAIAYTAGAGIEGIAAGQTIISYRGTNPDGPFGANLFDDALKGYGIATGFANGPQARQTIEFYKKVLGVTDGKSAG